MSAPAAAPPAAHYRLRDLEVRVRADDPRVAHALHRLCAQFACDGHRSLPLEVDVRRGPFGDWEIREDGDVVARRATVLGAARHIEWRIVGRAARRERARVHWHAAALTRGGRTLLLAGPPEGGKSVLALALTALGFELLGEDLVFMDPRTGVVEPFPRAPHVRAGGFRLLREAGVALPEHAETDGVIEAGSLTCWRRTPSPPLTHVVFTRWDRGVAATVVSPLTQAEAAIRLRASSHNLRNWPEHGWPLLQRLLPRTACLQLRCGPDLRAAAAAVAELVEPGA